jgi:hypothetical protein
MNSKTAVYFYASLLEENCIIMHGLSLISDGLMFGLSADLMAEGLVIILTTVEITRSGLFFGCTTGID